MRIWIQWENWWKQKSISLHTSRCELSIRVLIIYLRLRLLCLCRQNCLVTNLSFNAKLTFVALVHAKKVSVRSRQIRLIQELCRVNRDEKYIPRCKTEVNGRGLWASSVNLLGLSSSPGKRWFFGIFSLRSKFKFVQLANNLSIEPSITMLVWAFESF